MANLECFRRVCLGMVCVGVMLSSPDVRAACLSPPGDVTGDSIASVVDVQCTILAALYDLGGQQGPAPSCIFGGDITRPDQNCDGETTVVDVQITISIVLGMTLDASIDTNNNLCVDACETQCGGQPDGTPCDDQNACTVNDACLNQQCAGQPSTCNDGSTCTIDSCDPAVGCVHTAIQGVANGASYYYVCPAAPWAAAQANCKAVGGNLVTINNAAENSFIDALTGDGAKGSYWIGYNDVAAEGNFVWASGETPGYTDFCPGEPNNFNNNQDCVRTNWLCFGGAYRWDDAECAATIPYVCEVVCNDSNACTTDIATADGKCESTPVVCNDNNACTTDSCNPATGCVFTGFACDDNNPCTTDGCNPQSGCTATPVPTEECTTILGIEICLPLPAVSCDDNNLCTASTTCIEGGVCGGGFNTNCNDNNPCTVDGCNPNFGCTASNISADCCSTKETPGCGNPACVNCVCGMDSFCCDVSWDEICVSVAVNPCATSCDCGNLGCNDNSVCTTGDSCANGVCSGSPISCDDGLTCTADGCDPVFGCTYLTLSANCCGPKGNAGCANSACQGCVCTADPFCCDVVWDGLCGNRANNECAGACQCAATGCDDGNGCTSGDVCNFGACTGTPMSCNDGNPCTADSCNYACDEGTLSGSSCYLVIADQAVQFASAEAECQAWGGHLVAIESAAENGFVANQVAIGCPANFQTALIGLTDMFVEGQYVWTQGFPMTFSSWGAGEPNNFGDEDAVHIYANGVWNDISVINSFNCFICEKAAEGTCTNTQVPSGTPCTDDGNICTINACNDSGVCAANPVTCNDNNQCTADSCNPAGGCDGYVNGSSCYRVESPEPGSLWQSAESECQAWGGHLVSINTAMENAFVWGLTDECPAPGTVAFIGLNDLATEGVYQWIAGDAVTYTNWYDGEPNNAGDEDVTEMLLFNGTWNDIPTTFTRSCFVCEKPLVATSGCVYTPSDCSGDCCAGNGSAGCNDNECTECVCKLDPFCCSSAWDNLCASCAQGTGGVTACQTQGGCEKDCPQCDSCGNGFCGPNEDCVYCPNDCGACTGSCCENQPDLGCDDLDCQKCVCAIDAFCCNTAWDGICAGCAAGSSPECDACTAANCGQCDTCGNGVCLASQDCCDCDADCPGTCVLGIICL